MLNASGPLTLITEIAPVPGTVAGAQIVSSFLMYIFQFVSFSITGHILALFSGQSCQFEHLGHIKAHFCGQEGLSLLTDLVGSVDGLLLAVGLKPKCGKITINLLISKISKHMMSFRWRLNPL
jgi:hypothetical protein